MNRILLTGAFLAVLVGACSSSSSSSSGSDGGNDDTGDDASNDGGGGSGGDGGTKTGSDGGPAKDAGTVADAGPQCDLFTCSTSADCGGIAPCFSTSNGTNYCYEQEGNAADCSAGTTATTKTTSNGPTVICVPSTCPAPNMFLE